MGDELLILRVSGALGDVLARLGPIAVESDPVGVYAHRSRSTTWSFDDVVRDPDGLPLWAPRGKGESMDRVPSPRDVANEEPAACIGHFDALHVVGTVDGSFVRPASSRPDPAAQEPARTHPPFTGRSDIETAMLDALRSAMVCDSGLPIPAPMAPVRDKRSDIDTAMLEALRHAYVCDHEFRNG